MPLVCTLTYQVWQVPSATQPYLDLQTVWYAMMIQHNDSDTSCMRAHVPAERTFASEAEHTPTT